MQSIVRQAQIYLSLILKMLLKTNCGIMQEIFKEKIDLNGKSIVVFIFLFPAEKIVGYIAWIRGCKQLAIKKFSKKIL